MRARPSPAEISEALASFNRWRPRGQEKTSPPPRAHLPEGHAWPVCTCLRSSVPLSRAGATQWPRPRRAARNRKCGLRATSPRKRRGGARRGGGPWLRRNVPTQDHAPRSSADAARRQAREAGRGGASTQLQPRAAFHRLPAREEPDRSAVRVGGQLRAPRPDLLKAERTARLPDTPSRTVVGPRPHDRCRSRVPCRDGSFAPQQPPSRRT